MSHVIDTVNALEDRVGRRSPAVDLKVIDHLDEHARAWIAAATIVCVCIDQEDSLEATLAGGRPGFVQVDDAHHLRWPIASIDAPAAWQPGAHVGLLFVIPGLGETLRVNGVAASASARDCVVQVQECYGHCAKALLRSAFWQRDPGPANPTPAQHLSHARFIGLATTDGQGHADLSPKGDLAGFLLQPHGEDVLFADRPGNRRTDSFRNLLLHPQAAAVVLTPGTTTVGLIKGAVRLESDPALLDRFSVQGKRPTLVARLVSARIDCYTSRALQHARPWDGPPPTSSLDAAALFSAHVHLNKTRGLAAALVRAATRPTLLKHGLAQDYKRNLY